MKGILFFVFDERFVAAGISVGTVERMDLGISSEVMSEMHKGKDRMTGSDDSS